MNDKNAKFSFWGAVIFFITVAATVTVAMLVFSWVNEKSGGDRQTIALVMLLVILFLSVLWTLADLIRRRIMVDKPVEDILAATEKIATGDFSVRLHPRHSFEYYDEFDRIMDNINRLCEELGRSETLKNDFIANVSHELKTPLSVIQSYAAACGKKNTDEQTRKAYLQTLENAARRMSDLVANILKLNKLENAALHPEREWIRLDERLAEAVVELETRIEKKGLEVEADLDEVRIFSVPAYLDLVWSNLLSNAVKFTDEGGRLGVSLKLREGRAIVKISDTGCGIDAETGKRIFDKFYQGDTSHAAEGNGLGLALVKRVVDILGGEISVESEKGKGSVFTVVLREATEAA
ncbi:MAG: HAMP domain-containing histidine kinase [Clostridia bacterium]|nr:HAMP domain-containing histidine kinase [Clostridia bacterium]